MSERAEHAGELAESEIERLAEDRELAADEVADLRSRERASSKASPARRLLAA